MAILRLFFSKIFNLAMHLSERYPRHIFELSTIETANTIEETLIFFINLKTGEQLSKNLEEIFNNKQILKYFNSSDAKSIGYTYGRLITLKRLSNEK